jgi:uncharacterized membrane protein YfcA
MDWLHYVVLFVAAVLAGMVNAVAGGGTLLTFPALTWALGNSIVANATSTVAIWPGALSSFWGYRSELGSSRRELLLLATPSLLGGVAGAFLLLRTSQHTFDELIPYLILAATLLFILQEPLARWQRRRAAAADPSSQDHPRTSLGRWIVVLTFQLLVGIYGGYFGAGIGILMLAAFGFLGFTNIHHMNALKNLNGMCINGVAAVMFIYKGLVDWRLALFMAVGALLGGYAGADTARRLGQKTVRWIVIFIGFALSISFFLR